LRNGADELDAPRAPSSQRGPGPTRVNSEIVPLKMKEFAYCGFGITLISASIAHFARGDARLSILYIIDPLMFLSLLIVSYVYFEKNHSV